MINRIKVFGISTFFVATSLLFIQFTKPEVFVKVENSHFTIDGKPYYYIGTNFWCAAIMGSKGTEGNRKRLIKELDLMKKSGINNVRIMVGAENSDGEAHRVEPFLQSEPGKYNQDLLDGLDFLLAEMGKRHMVAILYLNNSWDWSGGYGQYLAWNGYGKALCVRENKDWNNYQNFNGQFNTCDKCIEQYHNHIKFILGRTNAYTKQKYTDDPAIMAWELGNEPRAFGNKFIPAFEKMVNSTAALIKSIDHNHLVTTGTEGEMGCEGSIDLFERIHTSSDIDYLTMHIWPLNWGWVKQENIALTFDKAIEKMNDYIAKHIQVAEKLNKPLVLEEFGIPRDNYGFSPNDKIYLRDKYYENVFKQVAESYKNKGVFAGANFWAWGGLGRPVPNQVWFRKGNDLLGDPPCEEQGVNSVFSSDSTINCIKKYINLISK